jgi:hypothetical protein
VSDHRDADIADDAIVIRFQSDADGDRSRRFTVHYNYLESIDQFLGMAYGTGNKQPQQLIASQRSMPGYRRIRRRRPTSTVELRRLLSISWASEMQLRLADVGGEGFLRYSNAWAPVQAYYAVYMSIHAWLATIGMSGLVDDHTSTLRTAAAHLIDRGLLPHPFNMTCEGSPELGTRQINGAPAGAPVDDHFENLAAPRISDFYPRFAKMLDSTRDVRLDRLRRDWLKKNGRKRAPREIKLKQAERLHPTSVFDYLWRLRIRANYGDVSAFLMSGVGDRGHAGFHAGLVTLTSSLCLLVQSLVVAQVGPETYTEALDEFVQGGGINLGEPVAFLHVRREAIAPM